MIDDDPGDSSLQQLRFWIDTDGDSDYTDETTLITDTTYIDGTWTAGHVGLFRVSGYAVTHEFDDVTVWIDNDDDGILDAADDVQISDDFDSGSISMTYDNNGNLTVDGVYTYVYDAWNRLVEVQRVAGGDTTTIAEYEYDGKNRRLSKAEERVLTHQSPSRAKLVVSSEPAGRRGAA